MFDGCWIEHREHLTPGDFERAVKMVQDGLTHWAALAYLRGWAADYAWTYEAEGKAARDFEEMAYGR
jgi:hypothetical protein